MNIFEGAKFGDKYVTRDGRIALYLHNNEYAEVLIIEHDCHLSAYNLDGTLIHTYNPNYDIVSRYKEEIDEEKLDKLAREFTTKGRNIPLGNQIGEIVAFKAGYRKAMANKI